MVKIENGQLFIINGDNRLICTKPFDVVDEINKYLQACYVLQKAINIPTITRPSQISDEYLKLLTEAIDFTLGDIIEEVDKIKKAPIDINSVIAHLKTPLGQ